jgi:hypothetical protein
MKSLDGVLSSFSGISSKAKTATLATALALGLAIGYDASAQTTATDAQVTTNSSKRRAIGKGGSTTPSTPVVAPAAVDPNFNPDLPGLYQIADTVLMDQIRTDGFKWNTRQKDLEYSCGKVKVVLKNEDYAECPPQTPGGPTGDPSHVLTTWMYLNSNAKPQLRWQRVDNQSTLVDKWDDINRISGYFRGHDPMISGVNNLREDDPNYGVKKMKEQNVDVAASVGINPDLLRNLSQYAAATNYELDQMANWLDFDAEPHAAMLIAQEGIGADNKGVYRIKVHKRDGLTGHLNPTPVLTARLEYGNGKLTRLSADPSQGYSKIWAGINTRSGSTIVEREFGIDTEGQVESTLYIDGLEKLPFRK